MSLKHKLYVLGFLALFLVAPLAYQIDRIAMSLPRMDGEQALPGLSQHVNVEFDSLGTPTVTAQTRNDAYRTLGYLHARDRLFQMDLLRRRSAGRLAEIMGQKVLEHDIWQRNYGFTDVANNIVVHLPESQRATLLAYTEGVNAAIKALPELPPEFRVLHYRPDTWSASDSLLVALSLFQLLSDQEQDERMLTVMTANLPAELVAFLTPDTDDYSHALIGGPESRRPPRPIPTPAIVRTLKTANATLSLASVDPDPNTLGSNNWAVNGSKTVDGRAIVADDMHLPLGIPNVWYRARLQYSEQNITGLTLPGVPLVVVGSNNHIAWGFTNVDGDVLDLVQIKLNPNNPNEYRTPTGWRAFDIHQETIAVKDSAPKTVGIKKTVWGPISPRTLLGQPVAIRWTALDPAAVNLRLLEMDHADTLELAMTVLNQSGTPPQNAVLADDRGNIGWTLMGYFPRRRALDGSVSLSWENKQRGWDGFINLNQLPKLINPPEGFIATANNRLIGKGYTQIIGHGFSNSYRAHRIRQRLASKPQLTEQDLLEIQLDTTSVFYEFYRQTGLELLKRAEPSLAPDLKEAEFAIRQWNGRLDPDSKGIALLARWRNDLAKVIFGHLTSPCKTADPGFSYRWREQETPLRALLTQRIPQTLPGIQHKDWDDLLLHTLQDSIASLKQEHGIAHIEALTWGLANPVKLQHPFSRVQPLLAGLLDMPDLAGACNAFCIKVLIGENGASERLVASPNHPQDAILQMPGGQSGHPFSPNYRDQQGSWTEGAVTPFLPGPAKHHLKLFPADN